MKKIVYSLDYLRVIACIMVIGIHNMHLVSENVQDVRYIAINHFVKLGLPLFFVLSSIALENSVEYINDLKKYYSKKVLSLGIYFFIFSIFSLSCCYGRSNVSYKGDTSHTCEA